jgi:hypothetical protein
MRMKNKWKMIVAVNKIRGHVDDKRLNAVEEQKMHLRKKTMRMVMISMKVR